MPHSERPAPKVLAQEIDGIDGGRAVDEKAVSKWMSNHQGCQISEEPGKRLHFNDSQRTRLMEARACAPAPAQCTCVAARARGHVCPAGAPLPHPGLLT